jgi:hypothetical protein
MKVVGCEGNTVCGAIPKQDELIKIYRSESWEIMWDNNNTSIYVFPTLKDLTPY